MKTIRPDDLLTFTRQLTCLVRMQFPIDEGLRHLEQDCGSPSAQEALKTIESRMKKGESLSKSLSVFRSGFLPLYRKMVELGENTDTLDRTLAELTDYLEFDRRLAREINASLAYPFAVFSFVSIGVLLIVSLVLPVIYNSANDVFHTFTYPLPTRIFMSLSDIFQRYHLFWIFLCIILAVNAWNLIPGAFADRIRLALPLVGRLLRGFSYARCARSLAMLLEARIPLHEALDYTMKAMDNRVAAREVGLLKDALSKGNSLSGALSQSSYFPSTFAWMVSCGEKREDLPATLMEISEYYEREAQTSVKTGLMLLEPTAIILLGLGLGFFMLSVFLPLYQIMSGF